MSKGEVIDLVSSGQIRANTSHSEKAEQQLHGAAAGIYR
jgi:hypothetical protein